MGHHEGLLCCPAVTGTLRGSWVQRVLPSIWSIYHPSINNLLCHLSIYLSSIYLSSLWSIYHLSIIHLSIIYVSSVWSICSIHQSFIWSIIYPLLYIEILSSIYLILNLSICSIWSTYDLSIYPSIHQSICLSSIYHPSIWSIIYLWSIYHLSIWFIIYLWSIYHPSIWSIIYHLSIIYLFTCLSDLSIIYLSPPSLLLVIKRGWGR